MQLQELALKSMIEQGLSSGSVSYYIDEIENLDNSVKSAVKEFIIKNPFVITFKYPYQYLESPTISISLVTENFVPMVLSHKTKPGYFYRNPLKNYTYIASGGETIVTIDDPEYEYVDQNHFIVHYNGKTYTFPDALNNPDKFIAIGSFPNVQTILLPHGIPFKLLPKGVEFYIPLDSGSVVSIDYYPLTIVNSIETRFLRKNFRVGIHTPNELVTIVAYHIVKQILLKDFLAYLDLNGGYDYTMDAGDFMVEEPLLPANWYSRHISISFFIEDEIQIPPFIDELYPPSGSVTLYKDGAVATILQANPIVSGSQI